jgi:hypothetical protein
MIEIDEEKFYISNWQKHQNIDGLDKIRLQGKERQKKFRANKKILELETKEIEEDKELDIDIESNVDNNVTSNVTVKTKKQSKLKLGKYNNVKLTQKEYDKLSSENKNIDTIINWFSSYIEEKGYKSKSHNLTIRRWVIDACNKNGKSNSDIDDMEILYNKYKEEENEQERNS